jgi:hypothetical protein
VRKIIQFFKRNGGQKKSAGALKKKTLLCSTEAAAISIGIHVLLVLFAGSIVLIKYVQKREAAFTGENISRPKLERRQLQMPVKVQNLQKKSGRPKVTTRMVSASQSSFALPDITGMGGGGDIGFERADSAGERTLSSMGVAKGLGFGTSGVNFFGTKSKGEKLVFIVEAAKLMVEDSKGGYLTYQFVKDRLHQMIEGMNSATLFNVMVYSGSKTVMFRPQMVPATPENKAALKAWLVPLNATPDSTGDIKGLGTEYIPVVQYDSVIQTEAMQWLKPAQAAMEQHADNIFILCSGWGDHTISPARKAELFGLDADQQEAWLTSKGWPPDRVQRSKDKMDELKAKAEKILAEENAARAKKGLPPKIIAGGSVSWSYMFNELKLTQPEMPPDMTYELARHYYEVDEVIGHLDAVYKYNYIPQKLDKPKVHVVELIAADENPSDQGDKLIFLQKIAQSFKGRFMFLRGAKTMELLIKYNPEVNAEE